MKRIGSRFGGEVDYPTSVASILSAHVIGGDTEFLYHILGGDERVQIAGNGIRRDTINIERALVSESPTNCVVPESDGIRSRAASLVPGPQRPAPA